MKNPVFYRRGSIAGLVPNSIYLGFGVYSSNSLSYSYNGVNYKIYSNDLTVAELISIANGMEIVTIK